MTPPRHVHSPSHGRKVLPTHTRASKPSPLKASSKHNTLSIQSGRPSPGWSKTTGKKEETVDLDDDMAGLPHFCAMCEKQITIPGNSVLYCSESCRRKDGSKPLSDPSTYLEHSPATVSPRTSSYFEPNNFPDIIPQRSPTLLRPASFGAVDGASIFEAATWSGRTDSDASKWLSQFGTPVSSPGRQRRPQFERSRTSTSHTNLPSLSHTPSSLASPGSSYSSTRPLPTRGQTYRASTAAKSIDLVVPLAAQTSLGAEQTPASLRSSASTATAFSAVEGELRYEKKAVAGSPGTGSLKQLFSHEAIKAPPRYPDKRTG